MLTKHDELLCHQLPTTFDHVSDSGYHWVERLWCCAHDTSGKIQMISAFGIHPNRNIMDGLGLLSIDGKAQYNIRAARELRPNIEDLKIGPLSYDIIEPLKRVRWSLGENDYGFSWEVEFDGKIPPHEEEPHFTRTRGWLMQNNCRYGQSGRASGWVKIDGKTYDIKPDTWFAHRDHSWGLRPSMSREPGLQPPAAQRRGLHNWNIILFDSCFFNTFLTEDADGNVVYFSGGICYPYGDSRPELKLVDIEHEYEFLPGTRQLKSGRLVFTVEDGSKIEVSLRALTRVCLAPGGYGSYKGYTQGMWMGPLWVDGDKLDLTDNETLVEMSRLADNACEYRYGNEVGYGICELSVSDQHVRYGI